MAWYNFRANKPEVTEIENFTKTTPRSSSVKERTVVRQLFRQKESVGGWRSATDIAESTVAPNRVDLIRIYRDILIDAHAYSVYDTMISQVTKSEYFITNKAGEKDDKTTELVQKEYFTKLIGWIAEARYWGFTAIELGSIINDELPDMCLIPREYVIPEFRGVSKSLRNTTDLIKLDDPRYRDNVVFVGDPYDLGLLHKVAPLVIYKKETIINWQDYTEMFGQPVRLGVTDIRDPKKRQNMENMLENMGSAAYAVIDPEDKIEFVETSQADAYETYLKFIEMSNAEISKVIQGQTMTTDNGSSRSQAEVHENVKNDRVTDLKKYVFNVINKEFMPKMIKRGFFPAGAVFEFDNEEKISNERKMELLPQLLPYLDISNEEIKEITGIDVEGSKAQEVPGQSNPIEGAENMSSVLSKVQNAYKGYFQDECC